MANAPFTDLRDVGGVQHCHGDDCDPYFMRPLVYGDDLYTYVAHIPPGGGAQGDQEEADMFEMSLYILDGQPLVSYGEEQFTMYPHTALHCKKGVIIGFENPTEKPVSLVLSFTPAPKGAHSPEEMRKLVESRGRSIISTTEMNKMAGGLLDSK